MKSLEKLEKLQMELSSLLHDLHLSSSSEKPRPSADLHPITELLPQLQEKLIGSPFDTCSLIGRMEQLFQAADPQWLFALGSANQEREGAELQAAYCSLIGALIGCAALPLCDDDCSPLSAAAYQSVPIRAAAVSSALTALIDSWARGGGARGGLLLAVAPPLCVFSVTHFQDQLWTSSASRAAACRLQEALLRAGQWRDSAHLLMGDQENRGILGKVLDVLQPQLSKESLFRCESVKFVFSWTLLQVTRPALSPLLPRLLPPSLLLSDHHRPENCIMGVHCLHHIILHTAAADLRQFNRSEVLYHSLFRLLFTTEAAIVQLVLSCLLDLLLVVEKPPTSLAPSFPRRKSCHHDDVLRLVLTHMEAEHKVALRRVYAAALPPLVDRVGVAICRHLRRVERVVLGYLEIRDPPVETSRLKILEVLQKTIRTAWPRMQSRSDSLLRCLLRLLVDVSSDSELSDSTRLQLMDQASVCLRLLDACCHGDVQRRLLQVDSSCCSAEVLRCLETVTTATDR